MKKILAMSVMLSVCLVAAITGVSDTADPLIIVFYEEGCPSCEQMEEFLVGMLIGEPETAVARHRLTEPESMELLVALSNAYNIDLPTAPPIVFVGDDVIIGMGRAQEFTLRNAIGNCFSIGCESPIARLPISQLRVDLPRLTMFLAIFIALAWLQLR